MAIARDDDAAGGWEPSQSAYEGRTDTPPSDTKAGKGGPAVGAGVQQQPSSGGSNEEARRDGGGSAKERE